MSDFVVSARKYRPSTFESVVGQKALTTTLKNAIAQDKLSHAYLFCGPRGVGKTSCARIFAKTINCQNRTPEGEACNECESCIAANEQRSYNIMELDAASNNSVADIRQLIDQVYIAPTEGKYRVYIIDEVHMLSSSAFNAFLKTLEEPPKHAIFILATTEKHKVLPTIISRCQVHDFSRITSQDIADHLANIASKEGIMAEAEALQMIGIAADGGMRDALSMFDQIAGFGGGHVTMEGVRQNLNLLDEDEYFKLLAFVLEGAHTKTLILINDLLNRGYDGEVIMRGFSNFLRNVLLAQSPDTIALIDTPISIKERMQKAGAYSSTSLLWRYLKISSSFGLQTKGSTETRLALEVALMKMCELCGNSPLAVPIPPTPKDTLREGTYPSTSNADNSSEINASQMVRQPIKTYSKTTQKAPEIPKAKGTDVQKRYDFSVLTGQSAMQSERQGDLSKSKTQRRESYTEEQLRQSWHKALSMINSPMAKGQLEHFEPHKTEDDKITIVVSNNTFRLQIEEVVDDLLEIIHNELQNDHVSIAIVVDVKAREQLPQTPQEKLTFLSNENPWLATFVTDLGLRPRT